MKAVLCVYHANCVDGFGAAWAVREWAKANSVQVDFFAGVHGNPPPDVTDKHVFIVDFSYKRAIIDAMAKAASSILILDHHESAEKDLASLRKVPRLENWLWEINDDHQGHVAAVFDMSRSGAGLTWDFFHPDKPRPRLIDHIEDRDLWRFALEGTREILAAVFSYPYDFDVWDGLMAADFEVLRSAGSTLERKHHKDVAEIVKVTKRRMMIGGISVPVANMPYTMTSDAGNLMAEGEPFAACYWDTSAGRVFSLRSRPEGANVAEIASRYGGGGHAHAASFRMPIGWEGEQ